MPTAGGISNAVTRGHEIGCTALQVFTASPRQWTHKPLEPEAVEAWRQACRSTGMGFTVAHDSYLINLAAPDPVILEKSVDAFQAELHRAAALEIPWVVTHMGAHMGIGEEAGLDILCESLRRILRATDGLPVGIALETTAGQGTGLGHTFEQIARVVEGCAGHPRIGVCLDTCHIFVAGCDIRDQEAYESTLARFSRVIGLERLKVIHANDAKKPLGSRVDRHAHIGEGEIGTEAFRRLVNDPRLAGIPIIIETPDAETMHAVNLRRLRELCSHGDAGPGEGPPYTEPLNPAAPRIQDGGGTARSKSGRP